MPRKRSDPTDGEAVAPETGTTDGSAAPESETPPAEVTPEAAAESAPEAAPEPEPETMSERASVVEPEPAPEPAPDPLAGLEAAGPAESTAEPGLEAPRTEPLPDPPAAEEHAEEHHEEEAGSSFAARALTFLLLLLAGAALGIWGAPKLAPLLPSGLAPVSAWLTPGAQEAEARVDALETRVGQEIGDVQARVAQLASGDNVDTRIAAAVKESEDRIGEQISGLRQSLDQVDNTDARQRLAKVEAALQGQSAELNSLKQQLSGAAATSGQLSEEAAAKIDVYQADIDGLRAEMGSLQEKVASLGKRIDEVSAEADRQITTAQNKVNEVQEKADTQLAAAGTGADVALIRAAVAGGQPFEEPLSDLAARGVTVPEGLTAAAQTGVATLASLRDSFPDAAHAAIQASIMAGAGDGILARSRAFLEAQMASRSLSPKEGVGPDAVLSRMEDRLRQDDLDGALAEAKQLPSEAADAMGSWLSAAQLRAGAVDGLAELDSAVPATN